MLYVQLFCWIFFVPTTSDLTIWVRSRTWFFDFQYLGDVFNYKWIRFGRLIFGLIPHVYWMRYIFKWFKYLPNFLKSNIVSGSPCLFIIIWPLSGTDSKRYIHPLTWSSHIIHWSWIVELPLVQTYKLQINPQGNVLLTILDLLVFLHIATPTSSRFYQCELLLPDFIPSGTTIINTWGYQLLGTSFLLQKKLCN